MVANVNTHDRPRKQDNYALVSQVQTDMGGARKSELNIVRSLTRK